MGLRTSSISLHPLHPPHYHLSRTGRQSPRGHFVTAVTNATKLPMTTAPGLAWLPPEPLPTVASDTQISSSPPEAGVHTTSTAPAGRPGHFSYSLGTSYSPFPPYNGKTNHSSYLILEFDHSCPHGQAYQIPNFQHQKVYSDGVASFRGKRY